MPQPTRREARPSLRLTTHHVAGVDHPATFLMRFAPHAQGQMLCLRPRVSLDPPPRSMERFSRFPRLAAGAGYRGELQPSRRDGRSAVSDRRLLLTQDTQSRPGRSGCRGKGCAPQLCLSRLALCRDHRLGESHSAPFCADAPPHAAIAQTTWLYRLQTGDYRRTDPTIVSIHQRIACRRGVNHHHEAVCRRATKVWRAGEQSGGHRVQERPGVGVGPRRTACTPGFVEVPFSGLQGTSLCSRLIRQAPHARGQT